MAPDYGRERLGLLAFAFDAAGREVLDALAARPGLSRAHTHCCHTTAVDGGADQLIWMHRSPGTEWTTAEWAPEPCPVGVGLEAAVRNALDADRWRTPEGGVDLVDLALLSSGFQDPAARLPADTLPALRTLRKRFKKVGRILLLVDGSFETYGEAAPRGVLAPLPYADGSDEDLFDLVVLLDRINVEGMVVNDRAAARQQAARMLAHLTLGELAGTLYARIQTEKARLGAPGRYLSLGIAEWRLSRERGVEATAELLHRRMLTHLLTAEAPQTLAADPWVDELPGLVLPPKPTKEPRKEPFPSEEPPTIAKELEERGIEALCATLRASGWRTGMLESFLERRLERLHELTARATLGLADFMDLTFAHWYVLRKLGKTSETGTPDTVTETKEPRKERVVFFILSIVGSLVSAGVAYATVYKVPAGGLAAALGGTAIWLGLAGFSRTRTIVIPGTPAAPDLRPELRLRRGRSWVAKELVNRSAKALTDWRQNRRSLETEAGELRGAPIPFPFSQDVCASLLEDKSIDAAECLLRFWEEPSSLSAALGQEEKTLAEKIRDFARRICEPFAHLEWSDLFRAIGGERGLDDPAWREALEKARSGALPWLPVAGESVQTFLALPSSLAGGLREALSRQFPDQKIEVEIDGGEILVMQLTQGYHQPEG